MTFADVLKHMDQVLDKYSVFDISKQEWREYLNSANIPYRIHEPVALITRKGGGTHRVIDSTGMCHCIAAPEVSGNVVRWIYKDGAVPFSF